MGPANDTSPALTLHPQSPMQEVYRTCVRVARGEATALLLGETGTGKEVLAHLIHQHSRRSTGPFVAVNCGAIPENLLESELFGHARGAFTGAVAARRGRIASAEGGTLFLDEIGEMPLSLQVKLLRVLQERQVEPLGGGEPVAVNFRLVAATNRDLEAEVQAGRFRRDLYYRLLVCPLQLPALRERTCDIAPLFAHFWAKHGETRPVSPSVMKVLASYDWPGNIRELENLVERISVCAENATIEVADLPKTFLDDTGIREPSPRPTMVMLPASSNEVPMAPLVSAPPAPEPAAFPPVDSRLPIDLPGLMRQIEDRYIEAALRASQGNKKGAADLLGLQRTTLVEKLRRRKADAMPAMPEPLKATGTF